MAKLMIEVPEDVVESIRQEAIAECKKYFAISLRENLNALPTDSSQSDEYVSAFFDGASWVIAELEHPDFEF